MDDLFLHRPAWYVAGALIGFVVVGLTATINERIEVLGGFSQLVERAEVLLVAGGTLIGFGAKTAGGCTSIYLRREMARARQRTDLVTQAP